MKTSKKILLFVVSCLLAVIVGALVAAPIAGLLYFLWGYSFKVMFSLITLALTSVQIFGPTLWDTYVMDVKQLEYMKKYSELPFREYKADVKCGSCGADNIVTTDFIDSEFTCHVCKKENKLEPHFYTYVKTAPMSDIDDVEVMNRIQGLR